VSEQQQKFPAGRDGYSDKKRRRRRRRSLQKRMDV